ncbi:GH92 family glycosyl hydrolase [Flammeovirga sp. SubArs3]|uniref:GH92 family glycosyl hydrolase n=1 Tax=Flammeovirga sp. SubArs3 TaxID=2995316 RepID=UPI00248BA9E9|nr:GH92 family glycosyl hydrolase [Flammeovirga sp. SubArs3]
MNKYLLFFLTVTFIGCQPTNKRTQLNNTTDYTQYVNPFIGTDGTGHTFPGPSRPFAMVQPGPDNTSQGWDYTSGYQLKDSTILGFSQTRASGTGISEFGDILILPFTTSNSKTRKLNEKAEIGYYSVELENKTKAELTSTERVALHRYTFPNDKANIYINLQHGLRFTVDSLNLVLEANSEINTKENSISGYAHTKNWVERKYFFHIKFDHPIQEIEKFSKHNKEKADKYIINFKTDSLLVKVALSSVSVEGAIKNMDTELPHWNFSKVVQSSQEIWNNYLSKIDIEETSKRHKEIFYTSLYHLFLQPSNIADVDGKYRGPDDEIHKGYNKEYYSTLSLWDTYRAAHPLYTLITPLKVDAFVNTMIDHSQQQGFLPIWTAWGQENYCMIGNHSIPVIVDAYVKGFSDFDANKALDAMVESSIVRHLNSDWEMYNKYGYYPFDLIDNESVSRTLESGLDDYSISLMAEMMGKEKLHESFTRRSMFYKNLFDESTGLMRGKDSSGKFRTPFDPLTPTSPMNNPGDYTEANAWQYTWTPMQYDVVGYTELLGGKDNFTKLLDDFFSTESNDDNKHLGQEAMIGQYAHGNEPSHHIAYLYAYSDKPEKGEELVSRIYDEFYDNTPRGITGNDDCGQMSAWYIFSTLGFYPVNPVNSEFVIMKPQVSNAKILLGDDLVFEVRSSVPKGESVTKITYNGKEIKDRIITYPQIMSGGVLEFK